MGGRTVEILFMRHGQSVWNRKVGNGDAFKLLNAHGLMQGADEATRRRAIQWLSDPAERCCRADPAEPPPADVRELARLFEDPPLTLEGARHLHSAAASAQEALALDPGAFHLCIVSPMLRTIQTAVTAARHLPLGGACKWIFNADAREHNHPAWIDTWGTAPLAELRRRVAREMEEVGDSEAAACALREELQAQALGREEFADVRAALLPNGAYTHGLERSFLAALNAPPQPTAEDVRAAADDAGTWAAVKAASPELLYRPGGDPGQELAAVPFGSDLEDRWWLLDEPEALLQERARRLVESDDVRGAEGRGRVMVVTHSMLIREVGRLYVDDETAWAGPAPKLKEGQLVPNGAIFRIVLDLENLRAVEAGLYSSN